MAFRNAIRQIPEELLKEILSIHMDVPFDLFSDTSNATPFNAPDHLPASSMLSICKQWLRVATPLLYQTVIIRSKLQVASLERALKVNPGLAKFIKRLRLEGPYGKLFKRIIQNCAPITHLCLFFRIPLVGARDEWLKLKPFTDLLPKINPTVVVLNHNARDAVQICQCYPQETRGLNATFTKYFRKWTNLKHVYIKLTPSQWCNRDRCHERLSSRDKGFALALSRAPNLQTVHMRFDSQYRFLSYIVTIISKNDSIRTIDLVPDFFTTNLEIVGSFNRKSMLRLNGRSLSAVHPTLTQTSCALVSSFSDDIWSRILELATNPVGYRRLSIILACKKFQRLGTPYLYESPVIQAGDLVSFTRRVNASPALRHHVRRMKFDLKTDRYNRRDYEWNKTEEKSLADVFRLCPNIDMLDRSDLDCSQLTWIAFKVICDTSAQNMTVFRPSSVDKPPTSGEVAHASMFRSFKKVRKLRWNSLTRFDMSKDGGDILPDTLSSLVEFEHIYAATVKSTRTNKPGPTILTPMLFMNLPALRTLTLHGDCPEAAEFLLVHGPKVTTLEVDTPAPLLQGCPSATTLKITGMVDGWKLEKFKAIFHGCPSTHPLEKIVIVDPGDKELPCSDDQATLEPWYHLLDPGLYTGFPRLREIQLAYHCQWPTNEGQMATNYWPSVSARLMYADIKLTDANGRRWVPRLGDTSSAAPPMMLKEVLDPDFKDVL